MCIYICIYIYTYIYLYIYIRAHIMLGVSQNLACPKMVTNYIAGNMMLNPWIGDLRYVERNPIDGGLQQTKKKQQSESQVK